MHRRILVLMLTCVFLASSQASDSDNGKPIAHFGKPAKKARPQAIVFSPDGKLLAWVEGPGHYDTDRHMSEGTLRVHVWDVANQKEICELKCPTKKATISTPVVISPDSRYVALATYHEEGGPAKSTVKGYASLRVWDIKTGEILDRLKSVQTCDAGEFSQLAFSPDSRFLVTLREGQAERWKLSDGSSDGFSYTNDDDDGGVFVDALSSGGSCVAYVLNDDPVEIWDIAQKKRVAKLEKAGVPVAFTSKMIVTRLGKTFQLWETATYSKRGEMEGDALDLAAHVVIAENGTSLAYFKDNAVQLFDVTLKKKSRQIKVDAVKLAFAPDGNTLATFNRDGTVSLWAVGAK